MKHSHICWLLVIVLLVTSEQLFKTLEGATLPKGPFPKLILIEQIESIATQKKTTPPLKTLTMHEAVDISYHYKPNLLAYKYLIQASKIAERAVWSEYYPKIDFTTDVNSDSFSKFPHTNASFKASQLVYNFAGPQENYKQAIHNTEVIQFQEEAIRNNTRLLVEQAFLDCWKLQQQRHAIQALRNSSKEVFKQAITQERVNLLDKNDWLKQIETHTNDLSTIAVYEDGTSSSQKRLEFLLGYSFNLDIKPKTAIATKPITKLNWDQTKKIPHLQHLDFYYDLAIHHRPEIKEKQKLIEIQQVNINLARYARLPIFNLNASTNYDSFETGNMGNKTSNTIGLSIAIPIFDQLVSDYKANAAEAAKLAAILGKQEAVQQVKSDVEIAYYALSQEITRFKAEKYRFERASNEFELQKLQFKIGNISKVEFETAQLNWSNEQYTWLNARVNVETQFQQLMHDCGYPKLEKSTSSVT